MKRVIRNIIAIVALVLAGATGMMAQNSLPAPGTGGGFQPSGGGFGGGDFGAGWNAGWNAGVNSGWGWNPGPAYPPYWGSPWYSGWNNSPTTIVVAPQNNQTSDFQNQGTEKVISCGYDAQGVWRVVPLLVSYQYVDSEYKVNVLNAWNPWDDKWDKGVDLEAYACNHRLKGVTYKYYVVLPTGTFYFNL